MTPSANVEHGSPPAAKRTLAQRACECDEGGTCEACEPELAPAAPPLQHSPLEGGAQVFPGGDTRTFMKQLRSSVTDLANDELAEVGRTADTCPYIQHWLAHYEARDASHLQRAIQRYAKPGEHSQSAYQESILSRVRGALRVWKTTGRITGLPADGLGAATSPGVGESLGTGQPLDHGIRGKLESAYGTELGGVRVHTQGSGPSMAQGMSALAFTAGNNIAFAPGMYRPGSPSGDALIAHEVAHTIQQGGVEHPSNAIDHASEKRLEHEADAAAAGALGMGPAQRPVPHGGLKLQRCGLPDCTRYAPSGLRRDIESKRDCGLLDPPFRPGGMAPFPEYRYEDDLGNRPLDPSCYPMGQPPQQLASLGGSMSAGTAVGGTTAQGKFVQRLFDPMPLPPVEPFPIPMDPIPIPVDPLPVPVDPLPVPIDPLPVPGPTPIPGPTPLPNPWLPGPYPVVPNPTPSPQPAPDTRADDQRYLDKLTPDQLEYYRWLREAEGLEPEPGEDADDELPDHCPVPEPGEEEDEDNGCVGYRVRRRGGHVEHDTYATAKSGDTKDWYARGPSGADINYDGKTRSTHLVWEVKVRHGWFFNCAKRSLRDRVLARWDAQKARGMAVAAECDYFHIWACKDRWVAQLLRDRWGGSPPVIT